MATGSHDLNYLLTNRFPIREYGMDNTLEILQRDLAQHNQQMEENLALFCDVTTDKERITGDVGFSQMWEVDERGRARTQRAQAGANVGFPLRRFQHALGWTAEFLRQATTEDIANGQILARKAHRIRVLAEIKRAFYVPTNYSFQDYIAKTKLSYDVKALVNADGMAIEPGPNGETFNAATHTHYLARAGGSLAASDVTALINTVMEHGHSESVKIAISALDETAWRALSGFAAYPDPRIGTPVDGSMGQRVDITKTNNRAIGVIGSAEVWTKPWAIQNYAVCWDMAGPKPLAMRVPERGERGLYIDGQIVIYPLQAEYANADFGFGVWNRTAAAVLYYGGTTYTAPTIVIPR